MGPVIVSMLRSKKVFESRGCRLFRMSCAWTNLFFPNFVFSSNVGSSYLSLPSRRPSFDPLPSLPAEIHSDRTKSTHRKQPRSHLHRNGSSARTSRCGFTSTAMGSRALHTRAHPRLPREHLRRRPALRKTRIHARREHLHGTGRKKRGGRVGAL